MKTYTPQEGSTAWKVIEYFTTNPAEQLTLAQLESRFDKPAKQFHSILGGAVEAGVLRRFEGADDELLYALGKGAPNIKANAARNQTLRPDALLAGANIGRRQAKPTQIDPDAIVLRDSVPMPESRTGASKWPALLDRMKVNQSFVLPVDCRGGVGGAISSANKSGKTFCVRKLSDTEIGVWRLK